MLVLRLAVGLTNPVSLGSVRPKIPILGTENALARCPRPVSTETAAEHSPNSLIRFLIEVSASIVALPPEIDLARSISIRPNAGIITSQFFEVALETNSLQNFLGHYFFLELVP